jgi:ubiquinone/menaquinone biosynthesis C-methylase UbiE
VFRSLIRLVIGLPILVIVLHTIIRIVRHFYKFPMPQFMANLIDNPFRRKIQPPDETPARHGIEPGMTVLEVGPGNGTYTVATARRVGSSGKVVTIDIEPRMIERVRRRARSEDMENIEAQVADVYSLPFEDGFFDAIYMIAVIGEIPKPDRAMREFHRVLSPSGTLAFSEFLWDPDYPRAGTLIREAASAGFQLRKKVGNVFYYTLIFERGMRNRDGQRRA